MQRVASEPKLGVSLTHRIHVQRLAAALVVNALHIVFLPIVAAVEDVGVRLPILSRIFLGGVVIS